MIELLRRRRSIRRFKQTPVKKESIDTLVEAMLRSPSSRGLNPWHFVVVDDGETIARLSDSKAHGSGFLKSAPLAIVVCADPEISDVWVEDASIAALILHLAATDLGLGSCWIQIRLRDHGAGGTAEEYIKKELGLEKKMSVEAIIAIGYPEEQKPGHDLSTLLFDRVSYNRYGRQ
ncbi:MAG: nitroreductase family protein [Desulfocapsaceae bacterium]|jgi:nitroreductase|nr:nitroreductase family protein [Desulfocapsaceae bacterium]